MSIDYDINLDDYAPGGRVADTGCSHANKVMGTKSRCTDCPFSRCVKMMQWKKRMLLFSNPEKFRLMAI